MKKRSETKDALIEMLQGASGAPIPTSSVRRLGGTAMALFRAARLAKKGKRQGDEAALDPKALIKIITSIGKLKGVAMKMGQIMSYIDMSLPDELRDALSVLQTQAQPMAPEVVEACLREELSEASASALLETLEQPPVAAASIGQVHRAALPDGTKVAVKVQYPEIAEAISRDFGPAAIGTRFAALFYPNARFDEYIKEARDRFLEECDYLHEAHCQDRFREIYEGHPIILVPAVHGDYCSKRVLTTTFVEGISLDAFLATDPDQETRDRVGLALFDFYLGTLFRSQIYNCDPHPGNALFLPDGRVAMLDYGCTREFEARFISRLAKLTLAIHEDTQEAIHDALLSLAIVKEGKKYDFETIRKMMRGFYGPMLEDREQVIKFERPMSFAEVAKKKSQLNRFALPGEFLFLFRIRFGLMSVLGRMGTRANWYRLEKGIIEAFLRDHPLLGA